MSGGGGGEADVGALGEGVGGRGRAQVAEGAGGEEASGEDGYLYHLQNPRSAAK